ncbi:MAG TPA: polysaccharide biosynthesis/export family protein [Terracidiphilus sp.]|jgi:polysaccharide export outer membrane protein
MEKSALSEYSSRLISGRVVSGAESRRKLALLPCLLGLVVFSAVSWGQAADSNQPPATDPQGTTTTPPAHPRANDTYVIGDDDVLAINVWKDQELTRTVTVRSDGRISLPLVGEMQAAGRTPAQLEEELKAALVGFMTDPQVTVIVQTINSRKFNVLGEVVKPGSFLLNADTTVVDAIALAGGLKEFAKKKDIYIIRQGPNGAETRIAFNYANFVKGKRGKKDTGVNIQLRPHDTVVVP